MQKLRFYKRIEVTNELSFTFIVIVLFLKHLNLINLHIVAFYNFKEQQKQNKSHIVLALVCFVIFCINRFCTQKIIFLGLICSKIN